MSLSLKVLYIITQKTVFVNYIFINRDMILEKSDL